MKKVLLTIILGLSFANSKPVSVSGLVSRNNAIVAVAGGAIAFAAIEAAKRCSSTLVSVCRSTWNWTKRNKYKIAGVALGAITAVVFKDELFNAIDSIKDDAEQTEASQSSFSSYVREHTAKSIYLGAAAVAVGGLAVSAALSEDDKDSKRESSQKTKPSGNTHVQRRLISADSYHFN